ncbi:TetR family transcriptional regulator [Streptomyces sp. NPDC014734]|uniref:TetR family transcriptional regulator n=1 Tax=Streptomyces sp. NPDC014734 TaxID=3364886 RepID=UPI0036FDC24F
MVKQARAVRTRAALVHAAAEQFAQGGYERTSLARISRAADISMGALSFHFASKAELAEAVHEGGRELVEAALDKLGSEPGSALRAVVRLTLELTRLIDKEPLVRSAVRLARERQAFEEWSEIWLPTVRELLAKASRDGELREGALPDDVTRLVEYLTAGSEAQLNASKEVRDATESLERVWRLALAGVSATDEAV